MTRVIITGWKVGFKKVQFNKFIRERCGYRLSEATSIVGQVLKNERVEIEFLEFSEVDKHKLIELGVDFEIIVAA